MFVDSVAKAEVRRVIQSALVAPDRSNPIGILLNRSIEYSPENRKAKCFPLYSVLYPLTSSLSLSLESKGVRCISANRQIGVSGNTGSRMGLPW